MKLIGSYTSPFVRKISILLLEKGITFEFVNELPYNAENGVARYNPLGKVPALGTDEGEDWFDSPIIAEYMELLDIAPAMLPRDPVAALKVRQIEALRTVLWMPDLSPYANKPGQPHSSQKPNCCASARKLPAAWMCWKAIWQTVP